MQTNKLVPLAATTGLLALGAAVIVATNSLGAPVPANYPKAIGKGEGALNIVAWEGYADDAWIKPFEQETGCKVNASTPARRTRW